MGFGFQGDYNNLGTVSPVSDDKKKALEATSKVDELLNLQKKVDAGLAKMKAGPAKERLLKLRAENRGYFSNYILPAYNKVKSFLSSAMSGEEQLGLLPLIPFAAAALSTALVGYVGKNIYSEYKILNDPAFTAAQKTEILGGGGLKAVANIAKDTKTMVILGVLALGAVYLVKNMGAIKSAASRLRS